MNARRNQAVALHQLGTSGDASAQGPLGTGAAAEDRLLIRLNLLRALELHRRLALGIALAGLGLALAYVVISWPVYLAESQLYVQPAQTKVMAQGGQGSEPINATAYDSFVQQQVQSASNPEVLVNALHKLGTGAWQKPGETEQAAADRLGHAVEVTRMGTSYQVSITARAKDPTQAANIANAVGQSIVERAAGEGNAGDAQRITVLQEERDRIQNELKADYAEQEDLNKQLGMASVGTAAPDLIDDQIAKTREELIKAQTDHDEAEARFSAMRAGAGISSPAIDAEADDLVAADAGLTSMKTSLNQRRATLITQMANLTPSNPAYKQDAEELVKINSSLDSMMKDLRTNAAGRIQSKLRTDLERSAKVEAQLNGQLGQLARTAAGATPKLQRVNDLANDIVRLRNRYSIVDEQLHNVMLEDSVPGAVHMSVTAMPPLHPAAGKILKKALPLALGGLILGLLAAVITNKLDPRIYVAADVEQVLGFGPMAVVPDLFDVSDEVAAEHLLRLATTIEHERKQGELKSCVFTGTAAGVGVTTVATRVKEILTAMGRPVVLVDSSKSTPAEPRVSVAGLSLISQAWEEPGAQRGSRSTALLRQVTAQAEQGKENLVLTDAAPLTISAETEYLARSVDCVIVVIESGVTTRSQLRAAASALGRLQVATVGFVLNRVGLEKADPAFRRSVHDMEEHLNTRRTAAPAPQKIGRPLVEEPAGFAELPAEIAERPEEAPAGQAPDVPVRGYEGTKRSLPESAGKTAATRESGGGREKADRRSTHGIQGQVEEPAEFSQREARAEAEWPGAQMAKTNGQWPASANGSAPWWLDEAPANDRKEEKRPAKQREDDRLAAGRRDRSLPPWVWEEPADPAVEPPVTLEKQPAPEPVQQETASRLSGLKGLMSSLGLKKLGKTSGEAAEDERQAAFEELKALPAEPMPAEAETRAPRPTPGKPEITPVPAMENSHQTRAEESAAKPVRRPAIANPEYLPPKEFVPVKEAEQSLRNADTDPEADDDIRILPAQRGQYRRRR